MYGLIGRFEGEEWWVRRRTKGKSEVVISRESKDRVREYSLDSALYHMNNFPKKVRDVAKEIKDRLEGNTEEEG